MAFRRGHIRSMCSWHRGGTLSGQAVAVGDGIAESEFEIEYDEADCTLHWQVSTERGTAMSARLYSRVPMHPTRLCPHS